MRIGRPDASDNEVIAACCESFVAQLPRGYHTQLGEGAQRLSIARMMLKSPAIILLDEATALLDSLTQAEIQLAE